MDELRPEIDKTIAGIAVWTDANKGLVASNLVGFVRDIRSNLPEIVVWMERIGKGVVAFYALSAGVKTVKGAVAVVSGVKTAFDGAQKAVGYFTTAGTVGNRAYTATLGTMRIAGIAAGHGLGEMRTALNATKMAQGLEGITSKLGKAGLLGAALGVGVAIGMWLDHTFGLEEKIVSLMSRLTGLDDKLNANGKRYKTRAEANAGWIPAEPGRFDIRRAVHAGPSGFDMMADSQAQADAVSPVVVSHNSSAREMASALAVELQSRQTVDVNVTASPGTQADVKQQQPSTGSRSRLKLPASGAPR